MTSLCNKAVLLFSLKTFDVSASTLFIIKVDIMSNCLCNISVLILTFY